MDDYDLSGMDETGAREYLTAVMTSLRLAAAKRAELEKERDLWRGRAGLAASKGRPDLREQAESRAEAVSSDLERILAEETELRAGVERMKAQLASIRARPEPTIDADLLLAELEMTTGERDDLADRFREQDAETELDRLKRELREEEPK